MFNPKKNLFGIAKFAEPVVNVNDISRIAAGVSIKGDVKSPTDVRVDGNVDGSLRSESRIVVGEGSALKGSLYCTILDFWGKMDGDIYVRDTLSLKSTSVVKGSIHARKFEVEMGAQINGTISMITEEEYDRLFAKD